MTDCIEWQGSRTRAGYGQVNWNGKRSVAAHRLVFYLRHGHYPPVVMHTCDNPCCINIDHLRGGTHQDNSDDMIEKGRGTKGRKYDFKPRKKRTKKMEVSEKERKRRRVQRDADTAIPAQSFRFGKDVREKLLKVARRRDRSQADVMRDLIDKEFERLFG